MEIEKIQILTPPIQILLYSNSLTEIAANKKYKLSKAFNCYTFILSNQQPTIIFLESQSRTIRINKLLKDYTSTDNIKQQFINLLEKPLIIYNQRFTVVLIETIFIYSVLLHIDLNKYVEKINLDALIQYYFRNIT
jgi:hypothetical protein